ncbi:glycoside hydrolase family 16 protein [Xylona heveae TC161]|uniref:Glycoside hydrolase family 16 protein n=1 Tax=Xylona heveae (strain CBS 132557 / TC161) TaxID=1328760 RepID=A0A165HGF7_XYLHT|nr:glycoside hydrolase family 16 protein [Xylona heveae TC161]KZF23475.1 glycoside hydrolase family 16 protein [Xylona heveae TC161]
MSLSDLGHDYSRYPFRHRNSYVESSPPPPPSSRSALVDSSGGPLLPAASPVKNPFNDSARASTEFDREKVFSPFIDDRISVPISHTDGFPMFVDEKEWDDELHMPEPDDDEKFRPKMKDYMGRQAVISFIGLVLLILGLLCIFIVLPVVTFTGITAPSGKNSSATYPTERPWTWVNDVKYPLFTNMRTSLIDPATPSSAMTRPGLNGNTLNLVFSDEFTKPNRSFYPGDDPYWTAPNIWYGATQDLEWYDPDAVTTYNGTLQLRLDQTLNHNVQFRSGMLNSWNQICFKGGALEVALSLPGPSGVPGLWPGVWTMGNLGRPGYKASTEGVWPYTYDSCDAGITPNQSSPDGISHLPGQRLSSCTCQGEDHPTPGTGRGAPEIDVIEASVDPNNFIGVVTQSYQVAPYDIWYNPNYDFMAIPNVNTTTMNAWCGGPFQQGISGTTLLNNDWYDGNEYQKYAFEYTPGTSNGEIAWFVGDDVSYMMSGQAVGPNGNIGSRQISEEPMSIILNLGISNSWTWIDWARLTFPTVMRIDYVRWYQPEGEEVVTCDPPGYETTEYISNHPLAYNNPNLTQWNETGYSWPKNSLMHGC